MSARQPFRPTPRPDPQPPSSQSDSNGFHSQRIETDLDNPTTKSFHLSGLFNSKKRDQSLPTRKSKSRDGHQVPPQNVSHNSWSTSSHASKFDLSPALSPVLSSKPSCLGNISVHQSDEIPSAQVEDIPSSPIAGSGSATGSFSAQEANSQHLLPMINEVDEGPETINDPAAGSTSLFFAGRYVDGSSSRKRTQRPDEGVDNVDDIDAKRFKSDQVGSWGLFRCAGERKCGIPSRFQGPHSDHDQLPTHTLHPRSNLWRNNMNWTLYWDSTRTHILAGI